MFILVKLSYFFIFHSKSILTSYQINDINLKLLIAIDCKITTKEYDGGRANLWPENLSSWNVSLWPRRFFLAKWIHKLLFKVINHKSWSTKGSSRWSGLINLQVEDFNRHNKRTGYWSNFISVPDDLLLMIFKSSLSDFRSSNKLGRSCDVISWNV